MLTTASDNQTNSVPSWIKILGIVVVVMLVFVVIFQLLTPQRAPEQTFISQNWNGTQSNFSNIVFVGEEPIVPQKLPLGNSELTQLSRNEIEQQIIDLFNLKLDSASTVSWSNEQYRLRFDEERSSYTLLRKVDPNPSSVVGLSIAPAVQSASSIINSISPNSQWSARPEETRFYYREAEYQETEPGSANRVEVLFSNTFNNYPVFSGQKIDPPARVWLDENYELEKLTIDTEQISTTQDRSYNTISIDEALGQIESGNASIVSTLYKGFGQESLEEIDRAQFNTVAIEYRVEPDTGLTVPYYRFSGEITTNQNQNMSAEVITPAVRTSFE